MPSTNILLVLLVLTMAEELRASEDLQKWSNRPMVVTATRMEENSFDLPLSIDSIDAKILQEGKPRINLSESSSNIPGVIVNNRNNFSQDLALQIRGFGARSAFGVRGVRLYADGIPMTMPDGQGQTGTFNLDTAKSVEYLRGSFSALYGNSSGGVVQLFTQDGALIPTLSTDLIFGSYHTHKESVTFSDTKGKTSYVANISHFSSHGYRDHSKAKRNTAHAKIKVDLRPETSLTMIGTFLDQPDSEDPQGLTKAEMQSNRRQSSPGALTFNTRVSKKHEQLGLILDHQFSKNNTFRLTTYGGKRDNEQFLSTSIAAQTTAAGFERNGGGVSNIERSFAGIDLRFTHKDKLVDRPLSLTAGMNYDLMKDRRTGFENFTSGTLTTCGANGRVCGVKGALRRNEINKARNIDQYLQAQWDFHPRWSLSTGVRQSNVKFETKDSYVVTNNADDSGAVTFKETTPVAGLLFKLTDTINVFVNAGKSFETPTLVEMGYNADFSKSGLNLDLKPAIAHHYEIGMKAMPHDDVLINLAFFNIDTKNEIVVATSQGGRTTYRNTPESTRKGAELSLDTQLPYDFHFSLAYTLLEAKFSKAFETCKTPFPNGTSCRYNTPADFEVISAKSKIPGTYSQTLHSEVTWEHSPTGLSTSLEMNKKSSTQVSFNSSNGSADGYAVFNWQGGFAQKFSKWRFKEFLRLENIFNKDYVGSVRVADSNGRFYEVAAKRNWLLGINGSYQF